MTAALDNTQTELFYPSEIVDINGLRPWYRNYKIHGDEQLDYLEKDLRDFGQFKNVVIWRGPNDTVDQIVAGHGLVEAAKRRGWKRIEAKRLPSEWSIAQVEAALVADNRTAELSETDDEVLAELLQSIRSESPSLLESTGFDNDARDSLPRPRQRR